MPDKKIRCLAVDDEPPALDVLKKYISSVQSLELVGTCSDAVEALNFIQQDAVDLIFLDIQMPQILGTDFLRTLKKPPKVIFTTAFRKFAVEGFELDAVDYLLKPISFERFLKAVNKVMDASLNGTLNFDKEPQYQNMSDQHIYLRSDRKMIKVAFADIVYIESLKDYIKVVATTGTVITKQAISSIEETLPKNMFIRIHRSFIVALNKIQSYSNELIWLDKAELPISRMYRHEVEKILKQK
ncbi:LytR/AlgR family response regulator transcription factor [Terrimonas alba]|uniref:LytR/AlgR family response regulator transcription factor n=1 Tax=Terrimonas alba TaxID=3349636 RepID=UPI0035F26862